MAGSDDLDDDGERATFPWLATVRSLVTAVVGVLVVVVVVMVIVVVHHPEDIRISIDQGYIQSYQPWWAVTTTNYKPASATETELPPDNTDVVFVNPRIYTVGAADPRISSVSAARRSGGPYSRLLPKETKPEQTIMSDRYGFSGRPRVITTYTAAPPPVSLRVTWSTYNPSESGELECNVTSITVLDVSSSSPTGGMVIGNISSLDKPLNFSVKPQDSHTETQWVTINDTSTMQYIFDKYEEKTSFRAMVQVNATVLFKATSLRPNMTKSHITHYCWPVTVGYGTRDDTAAYDGGGVSHCETREVI